ncbi:MAG: hypothetical protein CMF42_03035 [Legionellales bacterium]|nr:hypothetical protein [Legionellales bacterium]OUX67745.1 MAG: hypothetical protein CBD38_01900 [bacterium TMED178]
MRLALDAAKCAASLGEVPIGAVIVDHETLIATGHNQSITLNDPTAHAEILVMRAAAQKLGNYRLNGLTLYVTLEPCMMCWGAMVHARIKRLVFGANDAQKGIISHQMISKQVNHQIEYQGGVLSKTCSDQLKTFFEERRH